MQKVTQILSVGLIAMLVFFTGYFIGNGTGKQEYRSAIKKAAKLERSITEIRADNRELGIEIEASRTESGILRRDNNALRSELEVSREIAAEARAEAGRLADDIGSFIGGATSPEK